MPIIQVPSSTNGFTQNFLRAMAMSHQNSIEEKRLDIAERAQKVAEKRFNLQQQEHEAQFRAAASPFLNAMQGQPQQMPALPGAQQQFGAQAATPTARFPSIEQARSLATPEAQRAIQSGDLVDQAIAGEAIASRQGQAAVNEALDNAMGIFEEEARRQGDPSILSRARAAINLSMAGMDSSLIRDTLPPDMADQVSLQEARLGVLSAQDERSADAFATNWLVRQGIVPEGVQLVPGASRTMLNVAESREGKSIDWMKEGLDFITSRVGDSTSGSSFPFMPGPEPGTFVPAVGGEGVEVEQAVDEWKEVVERYAPPDVRERVTGVLESAGFQRRARIESAVGPATDMLREAEDQRAAIREIREILGEDESFTDNDIQDIIERARERATRPRR